MFRDFDTISPIIFCRNIKSSDGCDYMEHCLGVLANCDGIFLLKNWRDSTGARIEKKVADIIKSFNTDFLIMEQVNSDLYKLGFPLHTLEIITDWGIVDWNI